MNNIQHWSVGYEDAFGQFHLQPVIYDNFPGTLNIIDQTKLPEELARLNLSTPKTIYNAIKQLCVRGAPAIGCAGAIGLAVCAQRLKTATVTEFKAKIAAIAEYLDSSRPTAVNLHWALNRCISEATGNTIKEINIQLLNSALTILAEDIELCAKIGQHGAKLITDGSGILTHCNAGSLAAGGCGTALAPIYYAHKAGKKIRVFSDETRPLLQGARLTAWELQNAGIDVTTICDSMAAQVLKSGWIQMVIVGADRVAANGDTANKIGTYQLAIAAKYHNIPFYVALPYSTIDCSLATGKDIPIEERSEAEIFHAPGVKVYNPAFDITPRALITGFITERGVVTDLQ